MSIRSLPEYQAAVTWLAEAGKRDYLPGVLEQVLAQTVAEVGAAGVATPQNPEDPLMTSPWCAADGLLVFAPGAERLS